MAILTSVKYVWSEAMIKGYRFHLDQSWWWIIQQLGLSKACKSSNNDVSVYLKCIFSSSFLKPDKVFHCFNDDLMTMKPGNKTFDTFIDDLLKTYVEQDPLFLPNIWVGLSFQRPQIVQRIVSKV